MGTPVRFPFGVSTRARETSLGSYPLPSPFHSTSAATTDGISGLGVCTFKSDFLESVTDDWTVTGSSSTFALVAAGVGGTAVLTPGGTTTASSAYLNCQPFQFTLGQKAWFQAAFQTSAVAGNVAWKVGLQYGSATTDGIWFTKPAASTAIKLVSSVNSTATDVATALGTAVAATNVNVAFYYNGNDMMVFVNEAMIARVSTATVGATNTYTLTNKALCPFFQITPTATDTLTADFVLAACELAR